MHLTCSNVESFFFGLLEQRRFWALTISCLYVSSVWSGRLAIRYLQALKLTQINHTRGKQRHDTTQQWPQCICRIFTRLPLVVHARRDLAMAATYTRNFHSFSLNTWSTSQTQTSASQLCVSWTENLESHWISTLPLLGTVDFLLSQLSGSKETSVDVNYVVKTELPGARKKTLVAVRVCLSRGRQIH